MQALGLPCVRDAADAKQNKEVVDGIFESLQPDYLVILGAADVVPHQPLINPLPDEDLHVDSDLPYACTAPFGLCPEDFRGPTRVVSRLPDVQMSLDPGYLVRLLAWAAGWTGRRHDTYDNYFAISAEEWKDSTRTSVKRLFGSTSNLHFSPTDGPNWSKEQLARRTHFINAHGLWQNPNFYGEGDHECPVAHAASCLKDRIREGSTLR